MNRVAAYALGWPGFFAAVAVVQYACVWNAVRTGETLWPGDAGFYAAATMSLVHDGDLDLANQCFPNAASRDDILREINDPYTSGFYALAADRRITIKQSPVLSLAAVPFYVVFGWRFGFLIFNLVVEDLLLYGLARLAGGGPAARGVTLLGFLWSGVWHYTVNFSPDLALCALAVAGLHAARGGRPGWAGFALGLAVSLKTYSAAFLFPTAVLAAWRALFPPPLWGRVRVGGEASTLGTQVPSAGSDTPHPNPPPQGGREQEAASRWRAAMLVVAGGIAGLVPGAAFNAWQFGAPWVSGYERQLRVENMQVGVADHSSRFHLAPLEGIRGLLFNADLGVVRTAPLWCLWPVAAAALLARRLPAPGGVGWVRAAVGVILLNLFLFSFYSQALEGSEHANRYLFPAVTLGFAVIAAAVEGAADASAKRR